MSLVVLSVSGKLAKFLYMYIRVFSSFDKASGKNNYNDFKPALENSLVYV